MKPARLLDLIVLNTYWLGLSFMWNSLHVIILPAVLLNFVPENLKNTYLGLLTFVGLVIAMLIQPVSGWLSDRWVSRWGRRRPLIDLLNNANPGAYNGYTAMFLFGTACTLFSALLLTRVDRRAGQR